MGSQHDAAEYLATREYLARHPTDEVHSTGSVSEGSRSRSNSAIVSASGLSRQNALREADARSACMPKDIEIIHLEKSFFGGYPKIHDLAKAGKVKKGHWVQTSKSKKGIYDSDEGERRSPRTEGEWGQITSFTLSSKYYIVEWDGGMDAPTSSPIMAYCAADPHELCREDPQKFKKSLKKNAVRLPVLQRFLYLSGRPLYLWDTVQTSQGKSFSSRSKGDWGSITELPKDGSVEVQWGKLDAHTKKWQPEGKEGFTDCKIMDYTRMGDHPFNRARFERDNLKSLTYRRDSPIMLRLQEEIQAAQP